MSSIIRVARSYVGMARKQNGGYNASISVRMLIFHLVVNSTRLKTVRSALWRCPNSTVALRLLENVVKVTNLEVVKIEFRHLPILLYYAEGGATEAYCSLFVCVCVCVCVCVYTSPLQKKRLHTCTCIMY